MLDYKPTLVDELKTLGLPVHYDITHKDGDTLGYSYITYRIKIWSKRVSELAYYSVVIDNLMRKLGFERIGTSEL